MAFGPRAFTMKNLEDDVGVLFVHLPASDDTKGASELALTEPRVGGFGIMADEQISALKLGRTVARHNAGGGSERETLKRYVRNGTTRELALIEITGMFRGTKI